MVWSFLQKKPIHFENSNKFQGNLDLVSCITENSWVSRNWYLTCTRRAVTDSMKVVLNSNFKNKQNSVFKKTLAIARYLIRSSSHLVLFFFWFETITFPWILNKNEGEMKI